MSWGGRLWGNLPEFFPDDFTCHITCDFTCNFTGDFPGGLPGDLRGKRIARNLIQNQTHSLKTDWLKPHIAAELFVLPEKTVGADAIWQNLPGRRQGPKLPKECWLHVEAKTTISKPFSVHWQMANTGFEAEQANGLRGSFFENFDSHNDLANEEHTGYTGKNWIECFIVKNRHCVARSGEFIVNVQ